MRFNEHLFNAIKSALRQVSVEGLAGLQVKLMSEAGAGKVNHSRYAFEGQRFVNMADDVLAAFLDGVLTGQVFIVVGNSGIFDQIILILQQSL